MSTSGEIVRRLLGQGMTGQQIGEAIGRDRSLVSQIARGRKPGENLRDALEAVEAQRAAGQARPIVPTPARRTTKAGRVARVRQPSTRRGGSWSTSTVKRQASRSGGRGLLGELRAAARDGREAAVTITFGPRVDVLAAYGKRGTASTPGSGKKGGVVEMRLGPAADVLVVVEDEYDGSITAYLMDEGKAAGYIDSPDADEGIESIELRTF